MKRYTYHQIPDLDLQVIQNPDVGFWSVVIPVERTNLVTNPSVETNTTGYTAVGGSIARSTAQQYHGVYSLAVTPTAGTADGVYYGTVSLTSGTTYAVSCKVYGAAGVPYKLSVATTGGLDLAAYAFKGTGRWQWVWVFWTETSSTTRRIYLAKNGGSSAGVFYVDGLQCEACTAGHVYPTTYIDGDQVGLLVKTPIPAYLWVGTRHASTSVRSGLTRDGGRVMNIQTFYRLLITGAVGLGLVVPTNVSLTFAQLDGAQYQTTITPPRQFSISGVLDADTPAQARRLASDLAAAVGYNGLGLRQPCKLIYQPHACRDAIGDAVSIIASYAGGLEDTDTALPRKTATISFTQYLPFIGSGDAGAALTVQQTVANVDYLIQRSATGAWSAIAPGTNNGIFALVIGPDGYLYAGGAFTSIGGVAANYIAKWDGTTWSALGTGMNSSVRALAFNSSGILYAGGNFTTAGATSADYLASWDGSAWSVVGSATALDGAVDVITVGPQNELYIGGEFANAGGVVVNYITKRAGTTWSALGAGADGFVYAISIDAGGNIYAAGRFNTIGGIAAHIAKWDGSAWSGLGAISSDAVLKTAIGSDGTLYAGGEFTSIGGVTASYIASWNGVAWSPLGTGVNGNVSAVEFVGTSNELVCGGDFSEAGGVVLPDRSAIWTGSSWVPIDVDFPGSTAVADVAVRNDGLLYIGLSDSGSATTAALTTVTNTGTLAAYPTLTITGPTTGTSHIYSLRNTTTGKSIYFNYIINAGETAVLSLDPANITFTSDFQGNILNKILPGSNLSSFALQPGANTISFFAASATVTATLRWQIRYQSLHDGTW